MEELRPSSLAVMLADLIRCVGPPATRCDPMVGVGERVMTFLLRWEGADNLDDGTGVRLLLGSRVELEGALRRARFGNEVDGPDEVAEFMIDIVLFFAFGTNPRPVAEVETSELTAERVELPTLEPLFGPPNVETGRDDPGRIGERAREPIELVFEEPDAVFDMDEELILARTVTLEPPKCDDDGSGVFVLDRKGVDIT